MTYHFDNGILHCRVLEGLQILFLSTLKDFPVGTFKCDSGASEHHEGATWILEGRHQDEVFPGRSVFSIHWTRPKGVYCGGFTLASCGSRCP